MAIRGQPQHNYVPVELTHVEQTGGSSGTHVNLSCSARQKWRAFGLNTEVVTGGLPHLAHHAGSSGPQVYNNIVDFGIKGANNNRDGMETRVTTNIENKSDTTKQVDSAFQQKLLEVSSRIEEAKCRAQHLRAVAGKNNNRGKKNASAAGKHRGKGDALNEEEMEKGAVASAAAAVADAHANVKCGDNAAAHVNEEQVEKQQPKSKTRTQGRKKNTQDARKSSLGTATKRTAKDLHKRTLFIMPSDPEPHPCQVPQVAFKEIETGDVLFKGLCDALNDPNRIQAPTLFVAFILHNGETNFSISAGTHGKLHFVRGVNPETCHLQAQSFVFRWEDDVFVLLAAQALDFLVRVLEELQGVEIVTFNAPSLLLLLLSYRKGNLFTSCISDLRIMSWMLQPSDGADEFSDYDNLLQSCQQRIGLAAGFRNVETCTQKIVVCHRVHYMAPLYRALYGQLGAQGLLPAFLKQEKRISLLCATMKLNGFSVNLSEVRGFKERCIARMEELRVAAQKLVPSMPNFNMQNHEDCRVAIFEVLLLGKHLLSADGEGVGSCSLNITKCGRISTSEETLKLLAAHHELPSLVIAYRRTAKLLQTYTVGMMETAFPVSDDIAEFTDKTISANAAGGDAVDANSTAGQGDDDHVKWVRLHPNFLQEGTDTGRLSCVEPNLQSLPRAKAIGDDCDNAPHDAEMATFRRCFAVPVGWTLISLDYEQIELRVLAHLSADAALISALTNATDIHSTIAETIFRKSPVSAEERSLAKRVVFGSLYGASPRTLAAQMGVSMERAVHVVSLFRSSYPQIDRYHSRVIEQCRADGFVRTISGRIRCLPDINDRVASKRSYAERQAFNTIVQGSAADVMKLAMIAVEREVLQPYVGDVRLLAQVHDELIFSLPTNKLREVVPIVSHCMTHALSLLVPLRVTVKLGQSLGEMEPWTVDHELGIR